MKRKSLGKRRVPGRRRFPVRPELEVLEARLVMSAAQPTPPAQTPPPAKTVNLPTVLVFLPPSGLTPANPGIASATGNQPPPSHDEVFFDSLLQLGGGHPQELLHFPASGGGNEDLPPEPVSSSTHSQELESEVFASAAWTDAPMLSQEETALVLAQITEALAE